MKVFGDFDFDERLMQLRRGGNIVKTPRQCLDILFLLLDRPGELITREEIRRTLWPDCNVDYDHSLDVLMSRLRATLGDDCKDAHYIQTVPKQGYRFVEHVKSEQSACQPFASPGWTRSFARYASVALLAGLMALLVAHTRYQRFIPTHEAPGSASRR
jgi:DNA-binding winged helix-turn-helix (wHTH) protein